ncbi:rhodanese-like domain-containing protein [Paenibacillus aquistagni]|uniref:Rhodanese-related sulfurtransferase n=1 Tax=Paenibacillus aquistagni TaxID=1852522 RepID=A0A1X7I9U4_9BACL|nr:rhodanese-like domain-containing protein [Paenibacillus aquistagni]SMG11365.1 Rhodanese-related sulfurtransferase [Paenibacillus aquistagni]
MTWMLGAMLAAVIIIAAWYRKWSIERQMKLTDPEQVCRQLSEEDVQILDIRDPSDYNERHIPNAVNIYIGRLPYVSKKELRQEEDIIIVSPSKSKVRRAMRILNKSGFRTSGSIVWKESNSLPCKERQAS